MYFLESPARDSISSLIHEVRSRASARSLAKKQSQSPMPSREPKIVSRVFPVFIRLSSVRRQRSFYQFSLQHFSSLFLDYSKQDQRESSSVFCCRSITFYSRKRISHQFYREVQVHKAKSKAAQSKIFFQAVIIPMVIMQAIREEVVPRRCELSGGVGISNPHLPEL